LSKVYTETIGQTVEEAKMAVIIQEVIGKESKVLRYNDG